jgi:hypothetical protein
VIKQEAKMKKRIFSFLMVLVFVTGIVFAGTVDLPRTGQTKCYDMNGQEIPCVGTGQDGEIQAGVAWPEPRFTDNGDDTMTDNLTGLMWTKDANLAQLLWQEALDYCNNLNLAGYSDWRLPNVNELESLINSEEEDSAAWLNAQGFNNVQSGDCYVSSTTDSQNHDWAWNVCLASGVVGATPKSDNPDYIWPVRAGQCGSDDSVICLPKTGQTRCFDAGGAEISCAGTGQDGEIQAGVAWPSPRFADHGNGTVTDKLTGLMWTKDANLSHYERKWQQALNYVAKMNTGKHENFGYTDWRLPNLKELESLIDISQTQPALPAGHPFIKVKDWYWSSTTHARFPQLAETIRLTDGFVVGGFDKTVEDVYVWPVRGGQVGPSDHFVISGTVRYLASGLFGFLPGVTMTLSGDASEITTTGNDGTYIFTDLPDGVYTITPRKTGYKFLPSKRQVTVNGAHVGWQNFTGFETR